MIDVVSRQVLIEDADARAIIEVLKDVRSIVDVHISAWQPARQRWRLLTHDEQRALWDFPRRLTPVLPHGHR